MLTDGVPLPPYPPLQAQLAQGALEQYETEAEASKVEAKAEGSAAELVTGQHQHQHQHQHQQVAPDPWDQAFARRLLQEQLLRQLHGAGPVGGTGVGGPHTAVAGGEEMAVAPADNSGTYLNHFMTHSSHSSAVPFLSTGQYHTVLHHTVVQYPSAPPDCTASQFSTRSTPLTPGHQVTPGHTWPPGNGHT